MIPGKYSFAKVAFIGTYVPRRCGIATFTYDLCESVAQENQFLNCIAVAINDTPEGYQYPPRVRFEVAQNDQDHYRLLADYLNMSHVDVVCIQFEYGIFGGLAGSHLLTTLRRLHMPVISTLHTVLEFPDKDQKRVLIELCTRSERLIVMSEHSGKLLQDVYGIPASKIGLIHHGIPDMPFIDPNYYKDLFDVEGHRTILTFGLLSPNKGIENVIRALPSILKVFPDVVYFVIGVTHPHILAQHGEEYRLDLQRLARQFGVSDNIIFINRFVDIDELCRFLGATDIYITPYLNVNQAVSGTLAYALGTGKAVISTPYWYALELLSEGRGRIVPFKSPEAIAETSIELFQNEKERHAMRKRAYNLGRMMIWKEVARMYLDTFQKATEVRVRVPLIQRRSVHSDPIDIDLPKLNLNHLMILTDDTGIFQHSRQTVPNLQQGYTSDDNARALIVALQAMELGEDLLLLKRIATRYLSFLDYAFNSETRRFRNMMGYVRNWLEETGSEDCHGRVLWALGYTVGKSSDQALIALAMNLFTVALPITASFTSPRAWAYTLLGLYFYILHFPGDSNARHFRELLVNRLYQLYIDNESEEWKWFEFKLAYDNPRMSEALIVSGHEMENEKILGAGLESLNWLVKIQTSDEGHFSPISNFGWIRGTLRVRYDQQPIEALSQIDACYRAYQVTKDRKWREEMCRAFEWFLGRNDSGQVMYDYASGGCHDGLRTDGVNANEGSESTLAFLSSLLTIRAAQDDAAKEDL